MITEIVVRSNRFVAADLDVPSLPMAITRPVGYNDAKRLIVQYVHSPLGEEVEFLAGSYQIEEEGRLPRNGKEVLYLVGRTSKITSCRGAVNPFDFIKVVDYIKQWRHGKDSSGNPGSEAEPARGKGEQQDIRDSIHQRHNDIDKLPIEFW